jgi:phosphatidylserine decarboxylase
VKKKKKSSLEDIILDRLHDQFFNLRLSCFMESSFFKNYFQTFSCLLTVRKVGQ